MGFYCGIHNLELNEILKVYYNNLSNRLYYLIHGFLITVDGNQLLSSLSFIDFY